MSNHMSPVDVSAQLQVMDGEARVSSRDVAATFGKEHREVMRAIRTLDCSHQFNVRNFAPTNYRDSLGREQGEYLLTRDGLAFLAMGFTGPTAAKFKEAYIDAFNQMEVRLRGGARPSGLDAIQAMLDQMRTQDSRLHLVEARTERTEVAIASFPLTSTDRKQLNAAINTRVIELGFIPNWQDPKSDETRRYYQVAGLLKRALKERLLRSRGGTYVDIAHQQMDAAISLISTWEPSWYRGWLEECRRQEPPDTPDA